jgi:hypothetical protein
MPSRMALRKGEAPAEPDGAVARQDAYSAKTASARRIAGNLRGGLWNHHPRTARGDSSS